LECQVIGRDDKNKEEDRLTTRRQNVMILRIDKVKDKR